MKDFHLKFVKFFMDLTYPADLDEAALKSGTSKASGVQHSSSGQL